MKREFTGIFEEGSKNKKPIYVGDLVVLTIPRKEGLKELNVFRVVKDDKGFFLVLHQGAMTDGNPNYRQSLSSQVHKVIGNIKDGINEKLLK